MENTKKEARKCLSVIDRKSIIERLKRNESVSKLAREYAVSRKTITNLKRAKKDVLPSNNTEEEGPLRKQQKNLDINNKLKILEDLQSGLKISDVAKKYDVSGMTVRRVEKNKYLLKEFQNLKQCGVTSKKNIVKKKKLEKALSVRFDQPNCADKIVTNVILKDRDPKFNVRLPEKKNLSGNGWLDAFKKWHSNCNMSVEEELPENRDTVEEELPRIVKQAVLEEEELARSRIVNQDTVESFSTDISKFIQENHFEMDQIYNADESNLYWKELPKRPLIDSSDRGAAGHTVIKDRVTVMFCANASGTHKIPLLLIGKSVNPRCFKNIRMKNLPIKYLVQKSARMNQQLFLRWYKELFLPEIIRKHPNTPEYPRRVLLLLDNAPSYQGIEELNSIDSSCQVMYLQPNTTSCTQPMKQGVIEKTKKLYRKNILRELLVQQDAISVMSEASKLTIKDCCYHIASAWNNVSESNIHNAWNKLLKRQNLKDDSEDYINDINEIYRMLQILPGYENSTVNEIEAWIEADVEECRWKKFSSEDILSRIQSGHLYLEDVNGDDQIDDDNDEEDNSDDLEPEPPTFKEAFEALKTFQAWSETRLDFNRERHLLLQSLKDEMLHTLQ